MRDAAPVECSGTFTTDCQATPGADRRDPPLEPAPLTGGAGSGGEAAGLFVT